MLQHHDHSRGKICLDRGISECKFEIYLPDSKYDGGGQYTIKQYLTHSDVLSKLNATDSIMEMCCGYGGIGYYLAYKLNLKKAIFVDIDGGAAEGIELNKSIVDFDTEFYESSAFNSYTGPKVDLIVTNPPHVTTEEELTKIQNDLWNGNMPEDRKERSRLILLDKDFEFHTNFCNDAHKYLNDKGQIVFFENETFIPCQKIKDTLGDGYSYELIIKPPLEPQMYMLIATKL